MSDSVFTKIIKGEIPSHKIYEDEHTLAFLDIHPIQPGMVVVVPKVQVSHFFELDQEDYDALWDTVKRVAIHMKQIFPDKKRICLMVDGLDISDHVHVKLTPVSNAEELRTEPDDTAPPDHKALAAMAEKLRME